MHIDDEPAYRVRLGNLCARRDYQTMPHIDYPNAAAIIRDGWGGGLMPKLAEIRDGTERVVIRRDRRGRVTCSGFFCAKVLPATDCRHVQAYLRAARKGQHLIIRDASATLLVWLTDASGVTPLQQAAYELALKLLPTEHAAGVHRAAEQIAALARTYSALSRQDTPLKGPTKTRQIELIDAT